MDAALQNKSGKRYVLDRPAIELAIAEVRFLSDVEAIPQETGLEFREAVRGSGLAMDQLEPIVTQEINIEMTPAGGRATGRSAAQGWACRDTGTGRLVTLMPFSVAVQTQGYGRWSDTFEPVLAVALEGVGALLQPSLRTRVGLRYVNRFANPNARSAHDWASTFDAALLGPVVAGPIADVIRSSQQQLELSWDEGIGGLIRHGAFVDPAVNGAYSYLLDLDLSDSSTEPFDPSDCLRRLTALNRKAAELFRSLVTESHLEERGIKVESEEDPQ